jgi:dihydroorotate dehydrogenase
MFAALAQLGFGFIEVGTVTPEPQRGNPKPRIFRVSPQALLNHLGFNNCGLVQFRQNLLAYRDLLQGFPLFANLGKGKATPNENALEDYDEGVRGLIDCVDGFVVNLSSPNTPGLRTLQNGLFLEKLAGIFPGSLPVWVKFAPDLENQEIVELCHQIKAERRFSGAVLTNTSRKLALGLPGKPDGGLSGFPLFERALECVAIARGALGPQKTLIAVGGITDGRRAQKMRSVGADLVEIYSGFVYRGPELIWEIKKELGEQV